MRFWPQTFSAANRNPTSFATTRPVSCVLLLRHAGPQRRRGEELAAGRVARLRPSFCLTFHHRMLPHRRRFLFHDQRVVPRLVGEGALDGRGLLAELRGL